MQHEYIKSKEKHQGLCGWSLEYFNVDLVAEVSQVMDEAAVRGTGCKGKAVNGLSQL